VVVERAVGDLNRDLPILLAAAGNENFRVGPPPLPVDDAEFRLEFRMRLDQQRLEYAFIWFNLSLPSLVFLGTEPGLLLVWHDFVKVHLGAISAKHRPAKPTLL